MSRTTERSMAVLNQKGGTGKTTTAVNLAAGFAEAGHRTLLIDGDAQGAVGTSLGIHGEFNLWHLLTGRAGATDCVVPIREQLDVITADFRLQEVETSLATRADARGVLAAALRGVGTQYRFVVIDCAPTLSLLTQAVLHYAAELIIPVACDYLSMVTLKQLMRTIEHINETPARRVRVTGVLPTFFDARNRISHEVVATLGKYFPDAMLPPVRVNTKLREAPSWRKTIFEYDAHSHGAEDYRAVVAAVLGRRAA